MTYAGGTQMGNWTVLGNSVDLIGGLWSGPPSGGGSVDLNGNGPGGIQQSFSFAPGAYLLSFYLSGNFGSGNLTKDVDVTINQSVNVNAQYSYPFSSGGPNQNYNLETLGFNVVGNGHGHTERSRASMIILHPVQSLVG